MADVKISQLPQASLPLSGTEVFPLVQNGVTVQAPVGGNDSVLNITALRAVTPTAGRNIYVDGYYAEGDGGGGNFYGVTGGSYTDNGGTIITPNGATDTSAWIRNSSDVVNAKWFGAVGDGVTNDTTAIQNTVNYAWLTGRKVYIPAGNYLAKITVPPTPGEFRGKIFSLTGDGAAYPFLGDPYIGGTRIVSPDTDPVLTYNNTIVGNVSSGHIYIEGIRFLANNTTQALYFQSFSDFCVIDKCEVRQNGAGNGIQFDRAYGGTIQNTHVFNSQIVAPYGTVRTGTAIVMNTLTNSGALLTLRKVSARGFNTGYLVGAATPNSILSTRLDQCECSTMTTGIVVNTGTYKTVVDNCFFEGIEGTCVDDKGTATTVSNCFMVGTSTTPFGMGINSSYATHGNVYYANMMFLSHSNTTGIDLYTDGDALGRRKVVRDNYIYNSSAAGSTNIVGLKLTGLNPTLAVEGNDFRPIRAWTSGSGTIKIDDQSTGTIRGTIPITDTLNEFQLYSNASISLGTSGTLTQTAVTGGSLEMGAGSYADFIPSIATNVSSLSMTGAKYGRLVILYVGPLGTIQDSPFMILAGSVNFTGAGILTLYTRIIGGTVYAYELSRSNL